MTHIVESVGEHQHEMRRIWGWGCSVHLMVEWDHWNKRSQTLTGCGVGEVRGCGMRRRNGNGSLTRRGTEVQGVLLPN